MRKRKALERWGVIPLLVIAVAAGNGGVQLTPGKAWAEGTSSQSASAAAATTTAMPAALMSAAGGISQSHYSVSGGHVVWLNTESNGERQIYARNEATGEEKALTSRSSPKDVPVIKGATVVWADKGNQDLSSEYWDIYSYDLLTGIEKKLNNYNGKYANPSVDGRAAVWSEQRQYEQMIYHDLITGAETSLGEGRYPVLSNGFVVYKNARDGGLSVLELSSGVTRSLIDLGGDSYVDWFVTNGEYVLWKQKNGSKESKFAIAALNHTMVTPQDLTTMSVKAEEYAFMSIGDTQAVFLEHEGGRAVLKGVGLSTGRVYSIGEADANKKYIGLAGDRLVYRSADGTLGSMNLAGGVPSEGGPGSSGSSSAGLPSSGAAGSPADSQGETVSKFTVGADGGSFSTTDGRVRLDVAAGTFASATELNIGELDASQFTLKDKSGRTLEAAGSAWRIQALADFGKAAQLTLAFGEGDYWLEHREKLGIYQYDETLGYWSYVGGVTNSGHADERYVRAPITSSGVYAVLLRNVSFGDVAAEHWASGSIEVLAARGIVDGISADTFAPKGTLTRAQFSKMLAGAVGISPVFPEQPTFQDVKAEKWSYGWVEAAAAAGLIKGEQGRFRPDDALTREEMMAMLVRAIEARQEGEALQQTKQGTQLLQFADHAKVSRWAKPHVEKALAMQLVKGSGNQLHPQQISTRAEAAAVIYRLMEQLQLL
ncbi:hypothetical protein YSY43_31310 [Paenibacillus sp. YSY-4.3]